MEGNIEQSDKSKQLNNLYSFIDKYRIIKSNNIDKNIKPSHTSMGSYIGSFEIPDDKETHFFKYYSRAIKSGAIPSLSESHLDQGPILIDLDFKYNLHSDTKSTRIYSYEDIVNVIKIYNQVILTYLSVAEEDMNVYLMEKQQPKIINVDDINHKITYKDGVHIVYPYLCIKNI